MAAILSLNGAKNNPKILTKNHGGPAKGGGGLAQGPLNTPLPQIIYILYLSGRLVVELCPRRPQQTDSRLKINQNNQFLLFYWRFGLYQRPQKMLVLVLPVLGTTRTWTWRAKKAIVCVSELIAAFIAIHGLCTLCTLCNKKVRIGCFDEFLGSTP